MTTTSIISMLELCDTSCQFTRVLELKGEHVGNRLKPALVNATTINLMLYCNHDAPPKQPLPEM